MYVLPSFSEMGAPRWPARRGAVITGLGMDTSPAEITAAAVEAMAFQAYDLFAAMGDVGAGTTDVAVDGGERPTTSSASCWRTSSAATSSDRTTRS